jgi:hypothetical protein
VGAGLQSRQEVDYTRRVGLRAHGIRLARERHAAPLQHARGARHDGLGA